MEELDHVVIGRPETVLQVSIAGVRYWQTFWYYVTIEQDHMQGVGINILMSGSGRIKNLCDIQSSHDRKLDATIAPITSRMELSLLTHYPFSPMLPLYSISSSAQHPRNNFNYDYKNSPARSNS